MAGVFLVMASAVRALDRWDSELECLRKIAKIATAEIVSSKDFNADWQRAAASLLVAIGSHDPDLMMEEVFLYFSGPTSALPAMLQILADFALAEALQFTPRLKDVLLHVLPILGSGQDGQRPVFANSTAYEISSNHQNMSLFLRSYVSENLERYTKPSFVSIRTMFCFYLLHLSVGARLHGMQYIGDAPSELPFNTDVMEVFNTRKTFFI